MTQMEWISHLLCWARMFHLKSTVWLWCNGTKPIYNAKNWCLTPNRTSHMYLHHSSAFRPSLFIFLLLPRSPLICVFFSNSNFLRSIVTFNHSIISKRSNPNNRISNLFRRNQQSRYDPLPWKYPILFIYLYVKFK